MPVPCCPPAVLRPFSGVPRAPLPAFHRRAPGGTGRAPRGCGRASPSGCRTRWRRSPRRGRPGRAGCRGRRRGRRSLVTSVLVVHRVEELFEPERQVLGVVGALPVEAAHVLARGLGVALDGVALHAAQHVERGLEPSLVAGVVRYVGGHGHHLLARWLV
ncbi:MAG: hypothetical protein GEV07_22100 [Streptosporangiales bacterium]|nr:hypothetical protein [Streptosporangiales bacterium]